MEEITLPVDQKKYKFKELKVYASTEWLADNKKKYRQVFDRLETTYIYAELSFYNKYFDRDFWEADIELRCYSLIKAKKEVCNLAFKRRISKYDHLVYIREGWGNKKEGSFWKKGTYCWEAWIDGEKITSKYFYVEDAGPFEDDGTNPYVDLLSLKLFEGPFDELNTEERKYFTSFESTETRYIYAEVVLRNKCLQANWQCELFIKFHNESRELKGQLIRLLPVKRDEEKITIIAGWGSNVKGSWWDGLYTCEVVFMDELLGMMSFYVEEEFVEGVGHITLPHLSDPVILPSEEINYQTFEEVLADLDHMVGLKEVKKKVRDHALYIQFLNLRKDRGIEEHDQIILHSVFMGNPGTGKTTVAKMMGQLYKKMGVLTKGHVYEVDRAEIVGEYIGQTAPKVKEVIEKARGGVLFIDEAYSLARTNDDSKDFGREVIEILVKEMSNGPGDIAIIMAGYPKEMKYFLDSNPGLKSRIKLYYNFPDYLPQELYEIAEYAMSEKAIKFTSEAKEQLHQIILNAFRNRNNTFGNARFVFDLVDKSKINLGIRIITEGHGHDMSIEDLCSVTLADVQGIDIEPLHAKPKIPVDNKLLTESLAELDSLIGIPQVKKEIHELVQIVQYAQRAGREVLNQFFLHTVFLGNPGTGKSTVARILARIFKALGILERGHMIETDRQGLVAGYLGQSAIKTAEKIEEAIGGVLFIDEAYSLTQSISGQGDYGAEVIQTLLKRMEDQRGQFFVFVAGYTDQMEIFLKSNPGLSSRFDRILKFEDYLPQELMDIAVKMFADHKLYLHDSAKSHFLNYLDYLYSSKDKFFGNARTIRTIVQEIIHHQNIRLSKLSPTEMESVQSNLIMPEDLKDLIPENDRRKAFDRPRLGFRRN
ncbi:MAG: AAA family ATPase [Saprospiraceae bacterium]|nr:AAA family ATPase [Saprospiraceae bacterium]